MESKKNVAIVMTVYNRVEATLRCLSALGDYANSSDIYITDDGSTDNSANRIKTHYPNVCILKGDGNLFWNRGMFVAFGEAMKRQYDYYLWLNNDTYVLDGFLDDLIAVSKTYKEKAIICGATISEETGDITYGGFTGSNKIIGLSEDNRECAFASGNILLIPNEIAFAVGNLDYFYKHALGDFDYEGRARKVGFKIIQAAGYFGVCERHESVPKWRDINYPLRVRLKHLYSPLGRPPGDFWHYDKKLYGINKALFHYFTLHLRCIFPKLWGKRYDERE